MSSSRQLAAIMFTDIVGYTALMGTDEQKAFTVLTKNRALQKPIIEQLNGRWIKELGDGAIASFNTVSDAVKAAIQIQEQSNEAQDFLLRIGIHVGEVVFENNDVFGDGVNIASRIQAVAIPGSIFISGKVYDEIKNRKEIQALSIGRYSLKNVKGEMELFAISNPGIKIPGISGIGIKPGEEKQGCILVLPFLNMSNDPEQEYFSDGLTEELISRLSRLKDMKVISRTTSMKYKNTRKDIKTIGLETEAGYVMEGSVRRVGNNLRITAQFVDAYRDIHLWSDTYGGTLDDIFDIQEKVSEKIVEALRMQLTGEEKDSLKKRYTENTEAFQLYLKGRYFWKKRNPEGLQTAVRFFEKAIDTDPEYALAWAGLADTYSLMGEYTNISRRELLPKLDFAINKALSIDSNLAEARIALATSLLLNKWDWANAEKEYKLGIETNPNYANGHHWYAELLLFQGRMSEAFREISIAVDLDPVSQGILKDKGIFYYYNRQYDEAIDIALKTMELDPGFTPTYRLLSLSYAGKEMFEKAEAENQRWGTYTGNKVKTDVALAQIYAAAGRMEEAKKITAEVEAGAMLTGNDNRGMALIYVAMGNNDRAFEWLEKSYAEHEESLVSIKIDPKLDSLRSDPRFNILLKKIGLL